MHHNVAYTSIATLDLAPHVHLHTHNIYSLNHITHTLYHYILRMRRGFRHAAKVDRNRRHEANLLFGAQGCGV